jgi:hypothetical protein
MGNPIRFANAIVRRAVLRSLVKNNLDPVCAALPHTAPFLVKLCTNSFGVSVQFLLAISCFPLAEFDYGKGLSELRPLIPLVWRIRKRVVTPCFFPNAITLQSLERRLIAVIAWTRRLSQEGAFLTQGVLMSVEASRHRCKRLLAERKVVLPVLKMHDHNGAVFFHSFGIEA